MRVPLAVAELATPSMASADLTKMVGHSGPSAAASGTDLLAIQDGHRRQDDLDNATCRAVVARRESIGAEDT